MGQPARRSRMRPSANKSNIKGSGRSIGAYGMQGYEASKKAGEQAAARREMNSTRGPLRFYLEDGDEAEVIILDDDINKLFFMWEHEIWDGSKRHYIPCNKEFGYCAICKAAETEGKDSIFRFSYHAMYLSIIDTRPYVIQSGEREGEEVPHTRKLLPIKQTDVDKTFKMLKAAQTTHGTIRGTAIVLQRNGAKSARTGEMQPLDNGMLFATLTEDELVAEFGHDEVVKDGKVIVEADRDITAFDFDTLFQAPDQKALAAAWDLPEPPLEGDEALEQEWENEGGEPAEAQPQTRGRGTARRGAAPATATSRPARRGATMPPAEAEPATETEAPQSAGRARGRTATQTGRATTPAATGRTRTATQPAAPQPGNRARTARRPAPAAHTPPFDDEIPF